jgi:hypothetical protein
MVIRRRSALNVSLSLVVHFLLLSALLFRFAMLWRGFHHHSHGALEALPSGCSSTSFAIGFLVM